MTIFLTLVFKLIPLYIMIGLGYVAGKVLHVDKDSVSTLLIYMLAPAIIFYGIVNDNLNPAMLTLPLLFFALCCIIALIFLQIGKKLFPEDATKNILAFTSGDGNSGYFGFPLVLALMNNKGLGTAVLCSLGFLIYENTLGFFLVARGNHTTAESIKKLLRLPTIYAAILGVIFNVAKIPLGDIGTNIFETLKSTYTVLGMMMVGLGLSIVKISNIDLKFIATSFIAKFAVWPAIVLSIIFADKNFIHFYNNPDVYKIMIIMSLIPLAANTITYAIKLKVHPEKAAAAVMLSTLFALVYIPIMTGLLL